MIKKFAGDEDYYPVRRRGEKRRLNPNRAAKQECPRCKQQVKVNSFTSGRYYAKHNRRFLPGECPGSLTPVRT